MSRPAGKTWIETKGTVGEIAGVIAWVDSQLNGDTKELARKFDRSEQGLKEAFDYVKSKVKYKRDGREAEVVKFPQRTLKDGVGDCKSYSVLIGSILKDKNIPYYYKFTYTDKDNPLAWHVYPIAKMNGKQYIMDAVVGRFDKEHPYVKSFNYDPKKIVAVSGINGTTAVPQKNYIDTFNFSEGEITAVLLYEQLNIIGSQQPSPEIEDYKAAIQDALFKGLNSADGVKIISRIKNPELRSVLARATKQTRTNNPARNNIGISDPLIPIQDCSIYLNSAYGQNNPQAFADCENQNRYKRMLNEHLEGSAHHLLYEYTQNPNSKPPTVATKTVLHRGTIDSLASITKISRQNISLWLRNGVLRNNANRGIGVLQPEDTIPALQQAQQQGIGFLETAVIIAIIQAIAAAVAGTLALIAQMKATEQAQIRATAATIGQPNFGPLPTDWASAGQYTEETTQGGGIDVPGLGNIDLTTAGLIAAGIYFATK